MGEGAHHLIGELERLLRLPIGTKQELKAWYEESGRVQRELPARFQDLDYPHEVWHFLADADIRARDADYRKRQERIITDYIRKVRDKDMEA